MSSGIFGVLLNGGSALVTDPVEELKSIAETLSTAAESFDRSSIPSDLEIIRKEAETVGRAWSGSWIGYQAYVYFDKLKPPPPGAHFNKEWGLHPEFGRPPSGWAEHDPDEIKRHIYTRARNPDLINEAADAAHAAKRVFDAQKGRLLALLHAIVSSQRASFLQKLIEDAETTEPITSERYTMRKSPKGVITRDSIAAGQGLRVPPHIEVIAKVLSLEAPARACDQLAAVARQAFSFLERARDIQRREKRVGTNVFIGHGHSKEWRELKDFIADRLNLPWDEFNRVPAAGITNVARLSEMLDAAALAFIMMTAEDEQKDGTVRARENVVHEAGLFQGRLGFTKAIVLLEEGCKEFSNIEGLGQIRFPPQNVAASFEEIRQVLEREGLIAEASAATRDPTTE